LCADTRIETELTSSNSEIKIITLQHPNWVGMFAGVISNGREINAKLSEAITGTTLTLANIRDTFQRVIWFYKDSLVEDYIRRRFSMPYRDFQQADNIPPEQLEDAWRKIEEMGIECELIIAGFIDGAPHLLFTEDTSGKLSSERNFAAIGSGGYAARLLLGFRKQDRGDSAPVTMYNIYEAKKIGENAPGVSKETAILLLRPGTGLHLCPIQAQLEEAYKRFGPQPTDSMREMDVQLDSLCSPPIILG
jgi:hypothetical protein